LVKAHLVSRFQPHAKKGLRNGSEIRLKPAATSSASPSAAAFTFKAAGSDLRSAPLPLKAPSPISGCCGPLKTALLPLKAYGESAQAYGGVSKLYGEGSKQYGGDSRVHDARMRMHGAVRASMAKAPKCMATIENRRADAQGLQDLISTV
jgi:hypothetical protein